MERDTIHDLTAAYALDAVNDREASEYEAHLGQCETCRSDLAEFQSAAATLAYAAESPAPPAALRERILEQARRERSNVVPLHHARRYRMAVGIAAVAASAALGLGVWAGTLSQSLDSEREAASAREQALAVLANPASERLEIDGAEGTLAIDPSRSGTLVLEDLPSAPKGKLYAAWVSRDGETMLPAGEFHADEGRTLVFLSEPVPEGGLVAVTIEDAPGAAQPTSDPIIVSDAT